jgi:hypothetical protein
MAEIRYAAGVGPPPKQFKVKPKVEAEIGKSGSSKEAVDVEVDDTEAEESEGEEGTLKVHKITAERFVKGREGVPCRMGTRGGGAVVAASGNS